MITSRTWLALAAMFPGLAQSAALVDLRARQLAATCVPATVTSSVTATTTVVTPVLTTIAACQGPACSTNTITASGQPFIVTGLSTVTITLTQNSIIDATTLTNTGATPTTIALPTFTQCTGICSVSSSTFTDVPVFYTTTTEVPASTTVTVGQTCLANQPCTITTPVAMSTEFVPGPTVITLTAGPAPSTTVVGGTTIIVAIPTPPVDFSTSTSTSVTGIDQSPTVIPASTITNPNGNPNTLVGPTTTAQPSTDAATDINTSTPAVTTTQTTSTSAPVPTNTATTCTTTADCKALSGTICIQVPQVLGGVVGVCLLPTATSLLPPGATVTTDIGAGGSTGVLTTTTTTANAGPSPTSVLVPISCQTDQDCSPLGLGICLQVPNLLGSVIGVCSSPSSQPSASVSLSLTGVVTTTLAVGPSSTAGATSQTLTAAPTGTIVPTTGPGMTATSSAPTSGSSGRPVACANNEDCLSAGLGLCLGLSLLDSSLLGTCAQLQPTSRTASATATPSSIITVGSPCTSDAQCQSAGLGLCLGLRVGNVVTAGTCAALAPTTGASSTGAGVGGTTIGLPGVISSVLSDIATNLPLPTQVPVNPSTTTGNTQPTSVACSSNAQCFQAGLGVCVGLDISDSRVLGTCVQLLPSGGSSSTGAGASPTGILTAGSPCTSNAQCLASGLGLCLGLDLAGGRLAGVCADIGSGSASSSTPAISLNLPTATVTVPGASGQPTISAIVPTSVPTTPTSMPLPAGRCRSNADCLDAALGVCLGLTVGDASVLGVCAQVLPGTTTLPISVPILPTITPLQVGSPCTSDAQCRNAGLGLCLGLNVLNVASVGTCAQATLSSIGVDLSPASQQPAATPTTTSLPSVATPTSGFLTTTLAPVSSSTPTLGAAGASCTDRSQCLANVCLQALGATVGVCA